LTCLGSRRDDYAIEALAPKNAAFESGDWLKSVIWDSSTPYDSSFTKLNLNLNDPLMLLEVEHAPSGSALLHLACLTPTNRCHSRPTETTSALLPASVRQEGLDPFNLSNDKEYRVHRDKRRIRQTFGLLEVQHAWPAQKLQLPYVRFFLLLTHAQELTSEGNG